MESLLSLAPETLNSPGSDGQTPLHKAASHGRTDILDFLIVVKSADLTIADSNGSTALHIAAQHGHYECVLRLLAAEADATVVNGDKLTPLQVALKSTTLHHDFVQTNNAYITSLLLFSHLTHLNLEPNCNIDISTYQTNQVIAYNKIKDMYFPLLANIIKSGERLTSKSALKDYVATHTRRISSDYYYPHFSIALNYQPPCQFDNSEQNQVILSILLTANVEGSSLHILPSEVVFLLIAHMLTQQQPPENQTSYFAYHEIPATHFHHCTRRLPLHGEKSENLEKPTKGPTG